MKKLTQSIKLMIFSVFMTGSLLAPLAAEPFYQNYDELERMIIADAYFSVAEHYKLKGQEDKGRPFEKMAQNIFPGIEFFHGKLQVQTPQSLKTMDFPEQKDHASSLSFKNGKFHVQKQQKEEESLSQKQPLPPRRPSGREAAAVRYFFDKSLRALFSENLEDTASLLSTRLYLPGFDQGMPKKDVLARAKDIYDKQDLKTINPAKLYDTKNVDIQKEGEAWTAAVSLTAPGRRLMQECVQSSQETLKLYYREYQEGWRLIAINSY